MPAQLTSGNDIKQFNPREARVFCEGLGARQASAGAISNPYSEATEKKLFDAYALGWNYANDNAGESLTVNNNFACPVVGLIPTA